MCEIIATFPGAYSPQQFAPIWHIMAICRSREYMCVRLLAFSTTYSVAVHIPQATIFPILQYAIYAIC